LLILLGFEVQIVHGTGGRLGARRYGNQRQRQGQSQDQSQNLFIMDSPL